MKKVPPFGSSPFGQPPPSELLERTDRRRLVLMSVLLLALLVAFVAAQMRTRGHDDYVADQQHLAIEEEPPPVMEEVFVPPFDLERLRGKVSDARETDRVLRESAGIEELLDHVRGFGDPQFAAMRVAELDPGAHAALLAEPAAHRARPYRARGTVSALQRRYREDAREQIDGHLRAEDGGIVYFTVLRAPEGLETGDFVRLDGLFFKVFQQEVEPGEWEEGPLLVGDRIVRSSPRLGELDPEELEYVLSRVQDDGTESMTRLTGYAERAKWELVRAVERPEMAEIDWEGAHVLDPLTMARLIRDGASFRGEPFEIPISRIQNVRTWSAGENPLRAEKITSGWIGNTGWAAGTAMIWFVMPPSLLTPEAAEMQRGDYVVGRGIFLKHLAYEDRTGTLRTAPYFVLAELEPFDVPEDRVLQTIAWIVATLTIFIAALFFVLLLRDKKKSQQFQAELVRRRRARRERLGGAVPGEPGAGQPDAGTP